MSNLTDLEICQKIAEIEGKLYETEDMKVYVIGELFGKEYRELYSPLTDDALWAGLILRYEVSISFVFCKLLINLNGVHEKNFTDDRSLKRKSLMLIIEANTSDHLTK